MAGISQQSLDPKRTIVVLNFPPNVGGDDLTIHFQKERHGGGDVDDVVVDGSVAFVTFDLPAGLIVLFHFNVFKSCTYSVEYSVVSLIF